jgi:hypothetical protein
MVYVNIRGGAGGIIGQVKDGAYADRTEENEGTSNLHYLEDTTSA